jgi:hypothetical protein
VTLEGDLAYCGCADGSLAVYELGMLGQSAASNGGSEAAAEVQVSGWGSMRGKNVRPEGKGKSSAGVSEVGTLLARAAGHSEVLTAVVVLGVGGSKGVISVGGDGCILHWHRLQDGKGGHVGGGTRVDIIKAAMQGQLGCVRGSGGGVDGGGMGEGCGGRLPQPKQQQQQHACVPRAGTPSKRDGAGRRAAVAMGGPLGGREGGGGNRCGTVAAGRHMQQQGEERGEDEGLPLQSIDKLPSWAAGGLSPWLAAKPQQSPSGMDLFGWVALMYLNKRQEPAALSPSVCICVSACVFLWKWLHSLNTRPVEQLF